MVRHEHILCALYTVLFLWCLLLWRRRPAAPSVPASLDPASATIFVSVASYRDTQCRRTLRSIFASAEHPERVVVGTCEQNSDDGESCVVSAVRHGQIRQISIAASAARGPCYARYLCASLHRDEDLFLQVDSHSLFAPRWDTLLAQMVNRVPLALDAFVLTHYPIDCPDASGGADAAADLGARDVPVNNRCVLLDNGQPTFRAELFPPNPLGFRESIAVGGGFLCMHRSVLAACPYDPNLDGVFNMEEVLHAARLFTRGVALLSPTHNLVCHKYTYADHKVPWTEEVPVWDRNSKNGTARCFGILDGTVVDPVFGLGTRRPIAEFWRYSGINLGARTTVPFQGSLVPARS
jgi:hypothetical protein